MLNLHFIFTFVAVKNGARPGGGADRAGGRDTIAQQNIRVEMARVREQTQATMRPNFPRRTHFNCVRRCQREPPNIKNATFRASEKISNKSTTPNSLDANSNQIKEQTDAHSARLSLRGPAAAQEFIFVAVSLNIHEAFHSKLFYSDADVDDNYERRRLHRRCERATAAHIRFSYFPLTATLPIPRHTQRLLGARAARRSGGATERQRAIEEKREKNGKTNKTLTMDLERESLHAAI